ncbi:synaptonemal complex central element protein 2 isoform X2 [Agelaius phoeniceus]|uniref:synaptonemal complex central element protein 2 isoform X2 n=1 Tax=Agelaius phoeniceus TaxID=39638 RepID=UPI004054B851
MSREEPDGPEPEAAAGESPFVAELGEDEPPGEKPDRPRAGPALGPRSSLLFASLDAAVEGLQQRVQDVLGRLNSGREEAHTELSGVRGSLLLKVSAERPPRSLPSFLPPGARGAALFRPVGRDKGGRARPRRQLRSPAGGSPPKPRGGGRSCLRPRFQRPPLSPRCPPGVPPLVPTLPSQMAARPGSCGPR